MGRRAQGSHHLVSFLWVCVNDCGWRLSVEVVLFKCCRVSVLVVVFLLLIVTTVLEYLLLAF